MVNSHHTIFGEEAIEPFLELGLCHSMLVAYKAFLGLIFYLCNNAVGIDDLLHSYDLNESDVITTLRGVVDYSYGILLIKGI